jgi:hypothetical protein
MGPLMTIPPPLFPSSPEPSFSEPATSAPTPPKPPSWWRRNRLALVILAVLVPVTAAGVTWNEWHWYFGYGALPIIPVDVEEDDTAELAGATWGPVRGGELKDFSGLDVPDGSTVIAAAIPVDPDAEGVGCDVPVLVEQATGREWRPARSEIGLSWSADEPGNCVPDTAAPYEMIVPFVVPDDIEGPFWVEVSPYGGGGSFLRFPLEP